MNKTFIILLVLLCSESVNLLGKQRKFVGTNFDCPARESCEEPANSQALVFVVSACTPSSNSLDFEEPVSKSNFTSKGHRTTCSVCELD